MKKFDIPLALLGAYVFVAGALHQWLSLPDIPYLGSTEMALKAYTLCILSFMSGVWWGQTLSTRQENLNLFLWSNLVAIASWLGFCWLNGAHFFLFAAGLFAFILVMDYSLYARDIISIRYFTLRVGVTTIVIMSLLVLGVIR